MVHFCFHNPLPQESVSDSGWNRSKWGVASSPGLQAFLVLIFAVYLAACNGRSVPTAEQQEVLAITVAATLTANAARPSPTQPLTETPDPTSTATATPTPFPTDTPTPMPTLPPNNVSGKICFPSDDKPAMTIYFEETEKETLVELPIEQSQSIFEVKLQPGTYIAYAWLSDYSRGGLYSRAVPCGMKASCDDHTLLPFIVTERELVAGIDLCDWFAGPFNVPYPPGVEQAQLTGNLSGSIIYPEKEWPALRVVAFNLKTGYWYWVGMLPGQTSYTLAELPPGTYNVVAYDEEGNTGGHADKNHDLIDVVVKPGKTTGGANITDWDAPVDAFPPDPTRD